MTVPSADAQKMTCDVRDCNDGAANAAGRGPLQVQLGVDADFTPARKAHPAFVVDDLQALAAELAQGGFPVVADQPLEGYDRLYVDDPFGNRIELMEPKGRPT